MPVSATHFIYTASVVVLLQILPKTWAANHPDNSLAKAIFYIWG